MHCADLQPLDASFADVHLFPLFFPFLFKYGADGHLKLNLLNLVLPCKLLCPSNQSY